MKILFLDIDGVLAVPAPGRKTPNPSRHCVEQLNRITDATGAQIVITSGRRFNPELELTLAEWGVRGSIIGRTPVVGDGMGGRRGEEIHQWLAEHLGAVEAFMILDDAEEVGVFRRALLKTDYELGLTVEIAEQAIARLIKL